MIRGETVQRLPFTGSVADSHGNTIPVWGEPEDVEGVGFDPGATVEPFVSYSNPVTTTPTLYGDYELPFQERDKCVARGLTYTVQGVTSRWKSPLTGRSAGAVVALERFTDG